MLVNRGGQCFDGVRNNDGLQNTSSKKFKALDPKMLAIHCFVILLNFKEMKNTLSTSKEMRNL